jgi:hypothetical protein
MARAVRLRLGPIGRAHVRRRGLLRIRCGILEEIKDASVSGDSFGLLGPTAKPMVCLGGASSWRSRTIKGIFCSFQWLDLEADGFDRCTPCMCLYRPGSMDRGAYVIPQINAYRFGHRDGTPTQHLLTASFAAAEKLGFDMRDRSAIRTIIDIVIEGLPDLICMPSEPPDSTDVIVKHAIQGIEATARVNGKKIYEELL